MAGAEDKKRQIVIIHGGDSFSSYEDYLDSLRNSSLDYERLKPSRRWRDSIINSFPESDILTPTMPNSANAQYHEWVIKFEKIVSFFGNDVHLIGHSLGAMFLAKYLHANTLSNPVNQLILIAGGYNNEASGSYGSFKLDSAVNLEKSAKEIHLFHSRDDFIVDFNELSKFQKDLPDAISHVFEDRGHFLDETFPELLEVLNQQQ